MNQTTRNYTLRYGETAGNEMVVTFQTGGTLRENLERVIPLAIDKQLVAPDCTPDTVRVTYQDQPLNIQLSLEEQVPDIAEFALLVVMDRAATISVRVRYKPDHIDEKSDLAEFHPDEVFEGQLKPLLDKVRKEHRFRGFRRKSFRIYEGNRRLDVKKSPAGQGLKSGSEIRLVPWAILGWPFGRVEFSLLALLLIVGLSYLAYRWWPVLFPPPERAPIERFHVTFLSDVDCRVMAGDTLLIALTGGTPDTLTVPAGMYDLTLLPKEYPITPYEADLKPTAPSDTVRLEIGVDEWWKGKAELMELNVYGFYESRSTANRIRAAIMVNGFPYEVDVLGEMKIPDIYRGTYDIRFDLPPEQCMWDRTKPRDGKIFRARESEFWFDFSRYDGDQPATLIFYYDRPQ
jgi:hypothetical protein